MAILDVVELSCLEGVFSAAGEAVFASAVAFLDGAFLTGGGLLCSSEACVFAGVPFFSFSLSSLAGVFGGGAAGVGVSVVSAMLAESRLEMSS